MTTLSPTVSPSPGPTPKPTPLYPFVYQPESDTAFGYRWRDEYDLAHAYSIRQAGWSWNDLGSGQGPFCYGSTCYNVTEECDMLGGTLLHDYVCSFSDDVKVIGPSCWRGDCVSNGNQLCANVGGISVGVPDGTRGPQWCLMPGQRSFVGPLCYGPDCFQNEALAACNNVEGGQIWNRNYCILNGYWKVVGPVCWGASCIFGDLTQKCANLGGELFARRWCVLRGCDWTVIGPTCTKSITTASEQCFEQRTKEVCQTLKGTQIGQRYCVIPGTQYTFIGPTGYATTEQIGVTQDFCSELRGNLGGFFNFLQSWDFDGRFCLVKDRLPTTGPICDDSACNVTLGTKFCNRFGGKVLGGGFMCALSPYFRHAVGPLRYGDMVFEGNPDLCEGEWCAVPDDSPGENDPRCATGEKFARGCLDRRDGCIPPGFNCTIRCNVGGDDGPGPSPGPGQNETATSWAGSADHVTSFYVLSVLLLCKMLFGR